MPDTGIATNEALPQSCIPVQRDAPAPCKSCLYRRAKGEAVRSRSGAAHQQVHERGGDPTCEATPSADPVTAAGSYTPSVARQAEDRIITIPNVISVVRLCLVPVFLWLLFGRDDRYGAAWLLAGLGVSDGVDGYIARHFNQVSTIGKVIDPIADRVLLIVGVVAIMVDGSVPLVIALLTLGRELLVTMATLGLFVAGAHRIDVIWFGKASTFGFMVAFPLFLVANSTAAWRSTADVLSWAIVSASLALGWLSLVFYIPAARRALVAEGTRNS